MCIPAIGGLEARATDPWLTGVQLASPDVM